MLPTSRDAFIARANRFASLACPVLHFPSDGSTLVRVAPMPASLRRLGRKVAIRKEGYYNASTLVFRDFSEDFRYVVGFVDLPQPVEHVWVKIGDTHYDPTWELFGSTDADYLPVFELDAIALCRERTERGSDFPPDLRDLVDWANRRRHLREQHGAGEAEGDRPQGIFLHNGVAL